MGFRSSFFQASDELSAFETGGKKKKSAAHFALGKPRRWKVETYVLGSIVGVARYLIYSSVH